LGFQNLTKQSPLTFEKAYFTDRNRQVSNYRDYRKIKYSKLCGVLIQFCQIIRNDKIVDFGCATGALVSEFKKRGFHNVKGTDTSYWAIEWGRENLGLTKELEHYNRNMLAEPKDFCIMLDVLEHIPSVQEIKLILQLTQRNLRKHLIIRIPVSAREGEDYYLKVSRNDRTHVQCHCKEWWIKLFKTCGYKLAEEFHEKGVIWSSKGVLTGVFKVES